MSYPSASNSGSHGPTTPARDRDRQQLFSSPSPFVTPQRAATAPYMAQPGSSSSNVSLPSSNSPPTSNAPTTVQALLAIHASASSPPLAALEQAVIERNAICGQNAQLWKLMEKQRGAQTNLLKDLERIRAERDMLRKQLLVISGSGGEHRRQRSLERERERDVRKPTQNPSSYSPSPSPGGDTESIAESSVGTPSRRPKPESPLNIRQAQGQDKSRRQEDGEGSKIPRQGLAGHYSDDLPTPRNSQQAQVHLSRSQEPLRDTTFQSNGATPSSSSTSNPPNSNLHPNYTSSPSSNPVQYQQPPPPPPISLTPLTSPPSRSSSRPPQAPPPLVVPQRNTTLPVPITMSAVSATSETAPFGNANGVSPASDNGNVSAGNTPATTGAAAVLFPRKASASMGGGVDGEYPPAKVPASAQSHQQHHGHSHSHHTSQQSRSQSSAAMGLGTPQTAPPGFGSAYGDNNQQRRTQAQQGQGQGQVSQGQWGYEQQQQQGQQGQQQHHSHSHHHGHSNHVHGRSNSIANGHSQSLASQDVSTHQQPQPTIVVQTQSQKSLDPLTELASAPTQSHATTSSTPTQQNFALGLSPPVADFSRHAPARDSRISLPDEAKRYMHLVNMGESPGSSPRVDNFSNRMNGTPEVERGHDQPQQVQNTSPYNDSGPPLVTIVPATASVQKSEFLDLDSGIDEDDEIGGDEESVDVDPATAAKPKAKAPVEDFPLPPTVDAARAKTMALLNDTASAPTSIYPIPSGSSETLDSQYSTQPLISQSSMPVQGNDAGLPVGAPAFRALPLLASDLATTTISVTNSTVRPNDRGKDVLSFIVNVNPGNGKEPWQVEKLFSDVLGLDSRVRASVSKSVVKKIASLPEGKLWKDHAPAKVDQRKAALEHYLNSLIRLPVKNKDEVVAFFTSDIVRDKKAVSQPGYKEGYLTKRGKNFGGWKTRYFVLQGPVLEYFDSRGGGYLGSIQVTGAQIGRQQRNPERASGIDEEKEYRHAFLIVEAKKDVKGNHPRHVLCAESDSDRDSWVEMLVRYFTGTYSEDPIEYGSSASNGPAPINTGPYPTNEGSASGPRSSTSNSPAAYESTPRRPIRGLSKDDIAISKGPAVPISQLAPDSNNAKLFQSAPLVDDTRASSPSKSVQDYHIADRQGSGPSDAQTAKRILERGQPSSLPDSSPLSSSMPTSSAFDSAGGGLVPIGRANSELGHYPDLQNNRTGRNRQHSPEHHRERKPYHPSLNPVASSPTAPSPQDRVPSPEKMDANGKVKISGPLNGAPIPAGSKFGKDGPSELPMSTSDRREKVKSRSFWGFGRPTGGNDKPQVPTVTYVPRAVFGVALEESLDVVQIANLPAVVFRCIQYLEAKKADQEEGIYRLSGSSAVIKSLKDRFNMEGDVDLLASDEYWDPHAIAGLLKSFLRELPASILTRDLHLRFLAVIDLVGAEERIKELSQLIAALPIANYSLLRALTAHLILIVQNSGVNKMTMRNVGIVFSPTLGISAGVFSLMLGEFNRVFNVNNEDAETPDETTGDAEDSPDRRRNSRQYSDAAADQLLGLSGRKLATPPEDAQSDSDDFSVQDESGTETTEGDATVESSSGSSHVPSLAQQEVESPNTPTVGKSKASHVAASRGLNLNISDRGNRHSRMMGLPVSPRPGYSPTVPEVPTSPRQTPNSNQ